MEFFTPSDAARLTQLAKQYRDAYTEARPYPHIVIDDLLPAAWLEQVLDEFPSSATNAWQRFDSGLEKKLAASAEMQMGPATRLLLYQLNSATIIHFLEQLTAIEGLVPAKTCPETEIHPHSSSELTCRTWRCSRLILSRS